MNLFKTTHLRLCWNSRLGSTRLAAGSEKKEHAVAGVFQNGNGHASRRVDCIRSAAGHIALKDDVALQCLGSCETIRIPNLASFVMSTRVLDGLATQLEVDELKQSST